MHRLTTKKRLLLDVWLDWKEWGHVWMCGQVPLVNMVVVVVQIKKSLPDMLCP